MPFVDFAELKTRVSIEGAMQMLGLTLSLHGSQYRGACPACKTGGDRALIVTPAKGLFYCFANKIGGDIIALTAHIRVHLREGSGRPPRPRLRNCTEQYQYS